MNTIRRAWNGFLWFIGTLIPSVTFCVIFVTFLVTIASRYIFKHPVTWSYEVGVLGYMWTMFFGVGLAIRKDEHVIFSLVYDAMPALGKLAFKVFYNVTLVVLLAIIFIPSLRSITGNKMITGVLKMPYSVVFAPFLLMLLDSILRSAGNVWRAVTEYRAGTQTTEIMGGAEQ